MIWRFLDLPASSGVLVISSAFTTGINTTLLFMTHNHRM